MAKLTSTDIYGSLYVQGALLSDSTLSATRLISTIATGTAPLTVASTTLVSNLNADLLDNQQGSYYLNYNNLTNKPSIPEAAGNGTITITAGSGLTTGGTFTVNQTGNTTVTLNHSNSITAGSVGPSAGGTLAYSGTFTVPQITYDAQGHISGTELRTFTLPAVPQGATLVNLAFSNGTSVIDTYDPDGANAKQLTAGSNITMTAASNNVTISSPDVVVTESGTGNGVAGITANGHGITVTKTTFLTSFTEADTLDSVTGRGNTTTNAINVGNITTTGYLRGPATFVIDPAVHGNNTGTVVIAGNLQVDGNTTTINSTTKTLVDPVITLGGDTAPTSDDAKDRGVEFRYFDSEARLGFFGYDRSIDSFTGFRQATNTNEVFSGTLMDARFNSFVGSLGAVGTPSFTFTGDTNTGVWSSGADTLNISTNGAERLRVTSTGILGVGTTTPGVLNGTAFAGVGLHNVFGTQGRLVTQGTASAQLLLNDSGATADQRIKHIISDDGVLHFGKTTDAGAVTNHMSIRDDGNVGIGAEPNTYKLRVGGTGFFSSSVAATFFQDASDGNYFVDPRANGSDYSAILFGSVGIGTTTPASTLPNTAVASSKWIEIKSASDTTDSGLLLRRSDNLTGFDIWSDGSVGNNYLDNRWTSGNLVFRNSTNGTPVEIARLNSTGLGIGTNSPAKKLHVSSTSSTSENDAPVFIQHDFTGTHGYGLVISRDASSTVAALSLGADSSNNAIITSNSSDLRLGKSVSGTFTEAVRILNTNGNVGIGTTAPSEKLEINGNIMAFGAANANAGGGLNIFMGPSNNSRDIGIRRAAAGTLAFDRYTSSTWSESFRVTSTGDIGIGTTSPGQKLEVAGNTKTQELIISDTSNVAKATMKYDSTSKSVKFVFA
jgi:hypothetical protein